MSTEERKERKLDEGEEKELTFKIGLEGPAEFISWMKENSPMGIGERLSSLVPSEFRKHMRAARREQLLAVRSLLDVMIEKLEKEEKPARQAVDVNLE